MTILLNQPLDAQNGIVNLFNPFHMNIDPMNRLLLVNFENDPDSIYIGFEPQVFDDNINGHGHLVIGWRVDGRVDVYHQSGLHLNPEKYDIAGKGLANMIESDMTEARFDINDSGVQARYQFYDIQERAIEISITESGTKKRIPFGLLAPMGNAATNPSSMPLVFLHDFYFVRKKHTQAELSINGKQHRIDNLPIPIDWTKMTFVRYSPNPLIVNFNPAADGELFSIPTEMGLNQIKNEKYNIYLNWEHDKPSIKRIIINNEKYPITLNFTNAFPNIHSLVNNSKQEGCFEIEAHPTTGKISGIYRVRKEDGIITIVMIPSGGWKPRPNKLSLRFLYSVAKIFRKWPTTYEWTAKIQEKGTTSYYIQSGWKRI